MLFYIDAQIEISIFYCIKQVYLWKVATLIIEKLMALVYNVTNTISLIWRKDKWHTKDFIKMPLLKPPWRS